MIDESVFAAPPALDGAQRHILAINNDPDVLALFRDLLEDENFRVSTQTYVDRDLTQITALRPDLIVLDYMWANEDASWSLLQMLRMEPATDSIPIILCTGAVREVEALEGHLAEMGVTVVLKPFNIDQLVAAIRDRLGADHALDPVTWKASHGRDTAGVTVVEHEAAGADHAGPGMGRPDA
jgi:DNA-binding response OmpR family regulator